MKEYFLKLEKVFMLGLCMCAAVACFTACGRKEVEYNVEGTGTDGEGEMPAQSQTGIPKHIEESLTTGTGEIKVNADVMNMESYGKLPVATMEIKDWSEQDIKDYAEAVFDKGSAEVILPIDRWSKEALLDGKTQVEEKIKELGFTTDTIYGSAEYEYLGYKLEMIQYCIEIFNENNVLENDGSYRWVITQLSLEGVKTVERATCQVKGTIGGKSYAMCIQKGGFETGAYLSIFQEKGDHYAEEIRGTSLIEAERVAPDAPVGTENSCSITEQEALEQVEAFVDQMGIQGLAVSGVYQAKQYVKKTDEGTGDLYTEPETRGYLVYLGREINGCTTPCVEPYLQAECVDTVTKDTGAMIETIAVGTTYGYEWIVALVTDEGIEKFQYGNPMEISEITTEQAEVMDFAQIHKMAMQYMQEKNYNFEIDRIELCIGRVNYEDSYALLPVWCYGYDAGYSDMVSHRNGVLVNAIDGSIIDLESGRPLGQ